MKWNRETGSLDFATLRSHYARGTLRPIEVVEAIYSRIKTLGTEGVWIHLEDIDVVRQRARELEAQNPVTKPLWGIPFSVKDCNDVPGVPTTNAFPPMKYVAESTGLAMQRILDSGALFIGKVNMDQFGIGLVGTRSPYGECPNTFDPQFISGGSSSGSAVTVANGCVSFSFANDAAGSGRVPAALNNVVGIKPTPGVISNTSVSGGGVVRTIETIAFFALTVEDGLELQALCSGFDPSDAFSKPEADRIQYGLDTIGDRFVVAVPRDSDLYFDGDDKAAEMYHSALRRVEKLGGTLVPVSMEPFARVRRILYDGPWIAERGLVMDGVVGKYRNEIFPVTRQILESASSYRAADVFSAIHEIAEIQSSLRPFWSRVNAFLVPSTPTTYTRSQIQADPLQLNTKLGHYTNFVNLLHLCAVAVPNGLRSDGMPQGVTFLGASLHDSQIATLAARYHRAMAREGCKLGATASEHPSLAS